MKTAFTCFAAIVLAAAALPGHSDPTPEQRTQLENCKIMSGAVFEFAQARDRKQAKMDAFKDVTHGQNYVPGSLLDETLQWAYAHPEEQPDTASGHFYGRCVLDTYDARSPDTEGELDIAAQGCQQAHPGVPAAIRDCIEDKAQDIVTRTQTALAAAATTASAAVTAVAVTQAPNAATVAMATPQLQPQVPATMLPPIAATVAAVPAAQPAVAMPIQVAPTQVVAAAPSQTRSQPVASTVPSVAPAPVPEPAVVAAPVSESVVATAPVPRPAAPVAISQIHVAPQVSAAVAPPLPAVAQASVPTVPPAPRPMPVAAPVPTKTAAQAAVVAKTSMSPVMAPEATLPPSSNATATVPVPPPNLAGFGKLTLGMPMDEAYKAMGSHGDTEWDSQGEVHTYMISDDHGFIEIRPSGSGTLYSIRVVGGADAHVAPVLNVVLGDGAFVLINNVGLPSSRTPLPGDKELWNYLSRNYAFEISPGGDVIGLRITDTSYVPSATTGAAAQ